MLDTVTFAPLIPLWLLGVLGAAALALGALHLRRHVANGALRIAAFAAVLAALANPVIRHEDRDALSDIAIIVVDESDSQTIDGRAARTAAAREAVAKRLKDFSDLEVRWVTYRQSDAGPGGGTQLFKALSDAMIGVPPERFAGALFITDGQVHDVPKEIGNATRKAPLHALITGRRKEADRQLVIEQAPRFAIVGQQRFISLRVTETDALAGASPPGRTVKVTVTIDGRTSRDYQVPTGERVNVPLTVEHGGQTVVELVAEAAQGELTTQNNRAIVTTQGIRERLRVLLVSGEPHAGERTWRNLLKADAAVDLVHFTILRPPEKQDGTPIRELSLIAFPTRELFSEKLDEFDLIIFDRYQRRGVLPLIYLVNVAKYVEDGGAVLAAAGPAFSTPLSLYRTPLADVLPSIPTGGVIEQPFRPALTEKGRRHPVTRDLGKSGPGPDKWGRWFRLIDSTAERGDVVMSGPQNKPLVVLARYGKGRVAQLLSDHAWLWARGYDGGGPQAELLRRVAHWLMKQPDLEEEALIGRQNGAAIAIERRSMADTVAPVAITGPAGKKSEITLKPAGPGLWRGTFSPGRPGLFQLDDGTKSAIVAVGEPDPRERSDMVSTDRKLKPVIAQSGGGAFWLRDGQSDPGAITLPRIRRVSADRRAAGAGWLGFRRNEAFIVKSADERALIAGLLALAVILSLLGFTWYREGR